MKRKMKLIHKILEWAERYADGDPKPHPEMEGNVGEFYPVLCRTPAGH